MSTINEIIGSIGRVHAKLGYPPPYCLVSDGEFERLVMELNDLRYSPIKTRAAEIEHCTLRGVPVRRYSGNWLA